VGNGLEGINIGLLEARMGGALSELVRRQGGVPHCAPALREARLDCTPLVASFLDDLDQGSRRLIVFLTASGATALFQEAEKQTRLPLLIRALNENVVVCRGPKPAAFMARHKIPQALTVAQPYTSLELLHALDQLDLRQADVTLVHYGERSRSLSEVLTARGARLQELCLYEWRLPEDLEPLRQMVRHVIDGRMDALMFTSQIQCRHLFQVASDMDLAESLRSTLKSNVVVGVIGPVCRAVLEEFGVTPQVEPEQPKMAALVLALSHHFGVTTRGLS
jgi:uroporphyrinogen-III synthase